MGIEEARSKLLTEGLMCGVACWTTLTDANPSSGSYSILVWPDVYPIRHRQAL